MNHILRASVHFGRALIASAGDHPCSEAQRDTRHLARSVLFGGLEGRVTNTRSKKYSTGQNHAHGGGTIGDHLDIAMQYIVYTEGPVREHIYVKQVDPCGQSP